MRRAAIEAPEEASRAKRARPIGAKPSAASQPLLPTLEVSAPEVVLPASLANHEFLVGSAKNHLEANEVYKFAQHVSREFYLIDKLLDGERAPVSDGL